MTSTDRSPHELITLGHVGSIACEIAVTSEPWAIGLDALVVPIGPSGFGELGAALGRAIPEFRVSRRALRDVRPDKPMISPMVAARPPGVTIEEVIFATAHVGGLPDSDRPPTMEAAGQAALSSVVLAANSGVRSLGLPLIGAGVIGFDPRRVAGAIVPAVRSALGDITGSGLTTVVFVARDAITANAIYDAWHSRGKGVQLRMVPDVPIENEHLDVLGHRHYATALAFLMDHPQTGTPLTIAINAPWGAGKTSLAKLTEKSIRDRRLRFRPPITCWFNAWHHDDAPKIATALAATVARAASKERSIWRRIADPLPSALLTPQGRRRRHLVTSLLSIAAGLAVLSYTGAFTRLTGSRVSVSVAAALTPVLLRTAATVRGTAADVGSLLRAPNVAFASGSLDEIRVDLGALIHQATQRGRRSRLRGEHRRLFVFIDDLERCQAARSIEVCETVNQLLAHEDVVVVLIGDMQTLATAAEAKYKDLAPRYRARSIEADERADAPTSFGQLYLEKIVQFRFDLPADDPARLAHLVDQLVGREPTTTRSEQSAPPPVRARRSGVFQWLSDLLRTWWEQRQSARDDVVVWHAVLEMSIDDVRASTIRTNHMLRDRVAAQRLLSDVEGTYLGDSYDAIAAHVRPLPRDVKRMLNRLRFILHLAVERELLQSEGPLAPAHVGKWALVAERWPDLVAVVAQEPHVMADLEGAKVFKDFAAVMRHVVPGYTVPDLYRLLDTEPKLAPVVTVLTRFSKGDGWLRRVIERQPSGGKQ